MTDSQHTELSKREFELLAFTVRNGQIYRQDRQTLIYSTVDNVPALIANRVRVQRAMGRNALVMEAGAIKADWSYLNPAGRKALVSMTHDDCRRLMRNVEIMRGVDYNEIIAHARRSFP